MTDTGSPPGSRRWLMLPVVLMAMFMAGFDIWAVNVAAPSLQRDLHVSDAALQLIVGGYAFMYASGMVTGGRLGDLFGYRRLFMIGVAASPSPPCCAAWPSPQPNSSALRLLQGLTGAAMVPQVLALITATFPVAERSRALAWFGVDHGLAFVSGQILGGGLIQADVLRPRLAGDLPGERAGRHHRADRRGVRGPARAGAPPASAGPAGRGRASRRA